jgi:hypothetical protein
MSLMHALLPSLLLHAWMYSRGYMSIYSRYEEREREREREREKEREREREMCVL